ncbi:hypothetical protein, partial [Klebsiella pneumoniae]|uniref:hypothetical protein n=1 Tax=Klebsiella pneumoniae TaxID=573 RepID=UPI00163D45F9
ELRNAIKRKYKMFKDGTVETDIMLEKQYKPIIQELRKTAKPTVTPKEEPKEQPKEEASDYESSEGEETERFSPNVHSSPKTPRFVEADVVAETSDPELSSVLATADPETVSHYVNEAFESPLTRQYIRSMIKGPKYLLDTIYGPWYD